MNDIIAPIIVATITLGIYKLFELFVGKRERLAIIEKMGEKFDPSMIGNKFSFPLILPVSFSALKLGSLLAGMGLGLLIGYIICYSSIPNYLTTNSRTINEIAFMIYTASVLLCGGLGLVIAFMIELKIAKKGK